MTWTDILTIAAILLSPVIAVQVERWLERQRETKGRKLQIFHTLMAHRATRLSPAYVEALNMIDLTFAGRKEKEVRDRWKECLDKLSNYPKQPEVPKDPNDAHAQEQYRARKAQYDADLQRHNDSIDESVIDLLVAMGQSLGYDFDKVHIRRGAYIPQAHGDLEFEQNAIRKGLVQTLAFGRPLPLEIKSIATSDAVEEEQAALRRLLIGVLDGRAPLDVRVVKEADRLAVQEKRG